ncbi:hypothetical protein XAB3213_2780008 [Xanthomonas citri pv. bilvae]|nr:hypothetical protein XAB3213_2780008 [Xanthomonas citri pv. bilvae]
MLTQGTADLPAWPRTAKPHRHSAQMEGSITTETATARRLNGRSLRMQGRRLQRHRSPLRAHGLAHALR